MTPGLYGSKAPCLCNDWLVGAGHLACGWATGPMSWRPQRVKSTAHCLDCECIKLRSCCELCSAICPKEQRKPHFCLNARPLVSLSPSIKGAWSCSSQYALTHPNYQINTSHLKRKKRKQKGNTAKYLPYPSCPGTKAVNYHLYIIPVPGTVLSTLYAIVLFQPYYKAVRKVLLLSSFYSWARGGFPGGSVVKNHLPMQESCVRSLGQEDLLEKEMIAHSSILAWKIPWTGESGRLQSTGSQKSWTQLQQ